MMFDGATRFPLIAIPLFILAGAIMNASGISRRLIDFALALLGFVRGGLAMVSIGASMFFAEISGSAVADVAALGSILIPAMKRSGYPTPFAAAVTSSLRASDIVARYGGEELVVLLPETTCAEAEVVAEKLREAIADQLFAIADGEALHITVSVGVAALERPGPLDALTPAEAERELVRLADDALYAAKRGGRNRVVTASPGAVRE